MTSYFNARWCGNLSCGSSDLYSSNTNCSTKGTIIIMLNISSAPCLSMMPLLAQKNKNSANTHWHKTTKSLGYCFLNRYVLRWFLNLEQVSAFLSWSGTLFQRDGPACEKQDCTLAVVITANSKMAQVWEQALTSLHFMIKESCFYNTKSGKSHWPFWIIMWQARQFVENNYFRMKFTVTVWPWPLFFPSWLEVKKTRHG